MTYKLNYKLPNGKVVFSIEWERGYSSAKIYKEVDGPLLKEVNSRQELGQGLNLHIEGSVYHVQLTHEAKGIEVTKNGMHLLGSKLNPNKMMAGFSGLGWAAFTLFGIFSLIFNFGEYTFYDPLFVTVVYILSVLNTILLLVGSIFLALKHVSGYYLVLIGVLISVILGTWYFVLFSYIRVALIVFIVGVLAKALFLIPFLKTRKMVKRVRIHNEAVKNFWLYEDTL